MVRHKHNLPKTYRGLGSQAATLAGVWKWYPQHMLQQRVRMARQAGDDLARIVMDGNLKLAGRVCGRPVAELVSCPSLSMFTAAPCSREPAHKKRRCAVHTATEQPSTALQPEIVVAHRRVRVPMARECLPRTRLS